MPPDPTDLLGLISLAALDRASRGPFADDGSLTPEAQEEVRRISELASDDEADLEELAADLDTDEEGAAEEAFAEGQPCKKGQTAEKTGCVPASGASGASKATVAIGMGGDEDEQAVRLATENLFGRGTRPEDVPFASFVGAPDDARVSLTQGQSERSVTIYLKGSGYRALRELTRQPDGSLVITNHDFRIDQTGTGLGSEIFARQVEQCAAAGIDAIQCIAAKGGSGRHARNGYYTWARLGYDQTFEELEKQGEAAAVTEMRRRFPKAQSVLDVLASPGGRDWWKQNGVEMQQARFDLSEGSRSRRVLEAYLEERAGRVSRHAEEDGSGPARGAAEAEEIVLTPEEEEALERAWRRLEKEWGE